MVHPDVSQIFKTGLIPQGGFNGTAFFFIMANIGTTIAPWMLFFQQSSVVDKNLGEKDIKMERLDTAVGAFLTIVVAVFCVIVTGTLLKGVDIQDAAQASLLLIPINKWVGYLNGY